MRAKSLFPIFVVLLLASTSYTQVTPNLIRHFKFGDIDDYRDSVAGTTGTAQGNAHIIWDDDRKSYVLNPDGDGSYVDTSVDWRDIVDTAITVAAWIKTDSLTELDTVVSLGYAWRLYADSSLSMAFECGNTQPSSRGIGSRNVNDGTWHHLVGTYDGSQSRLYVDGQLDGLVDASGLIDSQGDTYFGCIGALYKRNDGAARYFFNGLIDDVRIYDRALSADEVSDLVVVPEVSQPTPADGQTDVVQDVILGWTPGEYAVKHNVYFGTNLDDLSTASVNNPMEVLVSEGQDVNSYDPEGVLPFGQTYYWRVDEVNAPPDNTIFEGPVWSFTVEPYSIPAEMVSATASSQDPRYPPENTINGSGLDEADLHGTAATTMWLSAAGDPATWIQYAFDRTYKLDKMLVWNSNQAVESFVGFGVKEVTIEVSTNGTDWTVLENVPQFAQAPGTPDYAHNTTVDFGNLTAKYVKLTANSNWGGVFNQYGLSEVRFFHVPLHAREPSPDSGATDVDLDPVLSFRASREAAEHDVYLGTDEQAVIDGTAPVAAVSQASYAPPSLDLGQTYYWKVNEVNEAETPSMLEGDVWNFTTRQFLVVDDFESYNDLDPTDPESKRIFNVWIDGYQVLTNGSLVGYENPPFCERTIVHSGSQSMPFFYSNTDGAASSEAELLLSPPQNWTKAGAATFVLYFHGAEGNTGQLYVKVDGSKVVYGGDAGDIAKAEWNQWNIDLASLGVNLQNITKLSIGIDGNGASGTLYVDDVRLYRSAPALEAP